MGRKLDILSGEWGEIPHIQSLVVSKHGPNKGVPDDGITSIWPDYDQLTIAEKRHKAQIEYQRIGEFGSRWNDVLQAMELSLPRPTGDEVPQGRGESEYHRRLKEFVCANPEVVGLTANAVGIIEYPLPTLDAVDVLFKTEGGCVAIEVKSAVSDRYKKDYERGIFQVVKYRSLLTAMSKVTGYSITGNIDALLVLEGHLPDCYRPLANTLEVSLLENVKVES
ncbi:hypothetical protein [Rubinisphaera margarita]|uniref:hypothetical protein n=1 Tax=Rubinisphaera margarita TaxID=2909586 RepID=UPI001EE8418D|nr:hypothetical protein [Rubinisphaera margarita]MCG6158317.1 hypothetical protein [Rubinisphaera margarita]